MQLLSIDLAANESNPTGIAIFKNNIITTSTVFSDDEIIGLIRKTRPKLIGIDAPLTLPSGRKSINDRAGPHFRECDMKLRALGIRFFPVTLGAMRKLTQRGMKLKKKIRKILPKAKVMEIFPGASLDLLGLKRKSLRTVNSFLKTKAKNIHESDAAMGVFTLLIYSKGKGIELSGKDGCIVVP